MFMTNLDYTKYQLQKAGHLGKGKESIFEKHNNSVRFSKNRGCDGYGEYKQWEFVSCCSKLYREGDSGQQLIKEELKVGER